MRNKSDSPYSLICLILFSITLALGLWNPFDTSITYSAHDQTTEPALIVRLIQGGFILWIALLNHFKIKKNLYVIFAILILSTIINSINGITIATFFFFIKFLLCILLCSNLPNLLQVNNRYLCYSLLAYALVCGVISILFSIGFLDQYLYWSKGRVFLFGDNPNSSSSRFVLAFLSLTYICIENPFRWRKRRFALLLLLIPITVVILASGSRGSLIALCVCIMTYILLMPFKNKVLKILFVIVSLIVSAITISTILKNNEEYSIMVRMVESVEENDTAGRNDLNSETMSIYSDYPILGTGIIKFREIMLERYSEDRTVHNLYLYVLVTTGIVGMISFMGLVLSLIKGSLKKIKESPFAVVLLLYILILAYKTGEMLTFLLMWYVFAIVIYLTSNNKPYLYKN